MGEIERGEGVVVGGWAGWERLARPLDGRRARVQGFPLPTPYGFQISPLPARLGEVIAFEG